MFSMWSAENFGRKRSTRIGCLITIFAGALMTESVNILMFAVARLIMGFAIGALVTLVPLYQVNPLSIQFRSLFPDKNSCPLQNHEG